MKGLGLWNKALNRARRARPKARRKIPRGKSSLSKKGLPSSPGESAAVHHAQTSLLDFSDEGGMGDDDPAVVRTAETLTVAGSDGPAALQEKEARSGGGIPSR
ncbi:MAG: hypothetical protein ACW985_06095 [Candidatus Thorarchaeota archaeon]|jgi:hypothetical protein